MAIIWSSFISNLIDNNNRDYANFHWFCLAPNKFIEISNLPICRALITNCLNCCCVLQANFDFVWCGHIRTHCRQRLLEFLSIHNEYISDTANDGYGHGICQQSSTFLCVSSSYSNRPHLLCALMNITHIFTYRYSYPKCQFDVDVWLWSKAQKW